MFWLWTDWSSSQNTFAHLVFIKCIAASVLPYCRASEITFPLPSFFGITVDVPYNGEVISLNNCGDWWWLSVKRICHCTPPPQNWCTISLILLGHKWHGWLRYLYHSKDGSIIGKYLVFVERKTCPYDWLGAYGSFKQKALLWAASTMLLCIPWWRHPPDMHSNPIVCCFGFDFWDAITVLHFHHAIHRSWIIQESFHWLLYKHCIFFSKFVGCVAIINVLKFLSNLGDCVDM